MTQTLVTCIRYATLLVGLLCAVPGQAETVLRLGETATVMVTPDELATTMRVEASSASAADAQSRVNTIMREALALARQNPAITVSTGGYNVWRSGPTPQDRTERWQATQSLTLTSLDGPLLLTLVGELQKKGMVTSGLGWRLSRQTHRSAYKEATRQALSALRGRAEEAADLLDLRFASFKEINLDNTAPTPTARMMPAPMAAAAMASGPPPSVAADDVPVSATAQADAILMPR